MEIVKNEVICLAVAFFLISMSDRSVCLDQETTLLSPLEMSRIVGSWYEDYKCDDAQLPWIYCPDVYCVAFGGGCEPVRYYTRTRLIFQGCVSGHPDYRCWMEGWPQQPACEKCVYDTYELCLIDVGGECNITVWVDRCNEARYVK